LAADEETLTEIVIDHSLAVKKFDDSEDAVNNTDELGLTGSLSTWFDCIKDDLFPATDSVSTKSALLASKLSTQGATAVKVAPKSRKSARKSAAVTEQSRAQHESEMETEAPVLIDEKRKRRFVSEL